MTAPLHKLTILDFSPLLPGPFATRLLADLGATVIRIESPSRPDLVRHLPPFVEGTSAAHAYLNRNKRSLALDLKAEGAREAVLALVKTADVLVEQFRPGVMERLGLGYSALAEHNPRLIYCSITGYGQTGPLRDRAGHDINYLALTGLSAGSGRDDGGPPPLGAQIADVAGGSLHAVIGILAALRQRDADGLGQHIDIAMADCALHLNALTASAALAGQNTLPEQGLLNGGSHYDYYRCRDGKWLAVGSLEPTFLTTLCNTVGLPGLAAELGRAPQKAKVALAARLAEETQAFWRAQFAEVDACVEPVLTLPEALDSELARQRGWTVDVPHGKGCLRQPAMPIRFSRAEANYGHAGGEVGQDSETILREAGLDETTISTLRTSKALG
ncbi:CaiB/BaiF CoA transferase family protein [Chitinimonas sp. BJB300]|uniref:CaiB/BaiF CoA transferase family protein n=1 Tax=Chitinimonas sp. BJB300 TaxID=1559339 RepID=UPI000C10078C|nr:CaiB/BaiF CoA-transferase family protein [Chitinimonas sp. BJB300]PHV12290.1 carnitine dehydratase [Chitinimonas sp. BJB300]TSJ88151.1 CoA transferase [Chitinimonas sp. BJB300]